MIDKDSSPFHSPQSKNSSKYRPEIDGLRAIAIIAVIVNHFNKETLASGFLGVDIFFVISGFVITSSLATREHSSFNEFILSFYERRIKRIIPALIFCVLLTCLIGFLFVDPVNGIHTSSWRTGITALFGFSNLYLFKQSLDYFGTAAELNLFTQTWSLGVEEQFYFIYPLIFWFTGFATKGENGKRNFNLWIAILSIVSFVLFVYFKINNLYAAMYFLMPARFWEMGIGCLLFSISNQFSKVNAKSLQWISTTSLVCIVLSLNISLDYQLISTIFVVLMTSILIVLVSPSSSAYKLLNSKIFVYIGLLSYSIYLWHWSVIVISRWTIGIHWWSIPFQCLLTFLFAFVSYRYIEIPLRHKSWSQSKMKLQTIGYGIISAVGSAAILFGLAKASTNFIYSGTSDLSSRTIAGINYKKHPYPYPFYSYNCQFQPSENPTLASLNACSTKKYNRKIYFVGNSHTHHLRTLHYLLHFEKSFDIDAVTQLSCSFPRDVNQKNCSPFQSDQLNRVLDSAKENDLVVISNRYTIQSYSDKSKNKSWIEQEDVFNQLKLFSEKLSKKNVSLVVFLPIPEFKTNMEECVPQWFKPKQILPKECQHTLNEFRELRSETYDFVAKKLPSNIYIYDPLPALCMNKNCNMIDLENKPLYFDFDHLTDYAVETYIYPDFSEFLRQKKLI